LKDLFVISDIHGQISMLKELLVHWDPKKEILVIAGDMVDRGEDPYETVNVIHHLKKLYPRNVIVLKGNHEELFLRWLDSPVKNANLYPRAGGVPTVDSFLKRLKKTKDISSDELMAKAIKKEFSRTISFLRNLPLYFERGKYVVVHAGVHLSDKENWKDSQDDMLWIRDDFYGENVPNNTDKIFIFGHTPTHDIYEGLSTDIWVSSCQTKIGIDGGAFYGGTLNGLKIDLKNRTYKSIQIKHPTLKEFKVD
jgi:serine/threonine protein phosphatase 1